MSNELTVDDSEIIYALQSSVYSGATAASIQMVRSYCKAAGLDPMQKPVHIVPMWDSKSGSMKDVIMPGIGLYRIQASRTGEFAGMTEPEFGQMITEQIGGQTVTYPEYAKCTAKRILSSGTVAEFTAIEYWIENYAVKGGKEKSMAPNAMWSRRPRGQIGKCAQAQALRMAFPELGAAPTAEEMEGKQYNNQEIDITPKEEKPASKPTLNDKNFARAIQSIINKEYTASEISATYQLTPDQKIAADDAQSESNRTIENDITASF